MPDADPFDLNRFVTAQAPVFSAALDQLKAGRKRSHWNVVYLSAAARPRAFRDG